MEIFAGSQKHLVAGRLRLWCINFRCSYVILPTIKSNTQPVLNSWYRFFDNGNTVEILPRLLCFSTIEKKKKKIKIDFIRQSRKYNRFPTREFFFFLENGRGTSKKLSAAIVHRLHNNRYQKPSPIVFWSKSHERQTGEKQFFFFFKKTRFVPIQFQVQIRGGGG